MVNNHLQVLLKLEDRCSYTVYERYAKKTLLVSRGPLLLRDSKRKPRTVSGREPLIQSLVIQTLTGFELTTFVLTITKVSSALLRTANPG